MVNASSNPRHPCNPRFKLRRTVLAGLTGLTLLLAPSAVFADAAREAALGRLWASCAALSNQHAAAAARCGAFAAEAPADALSAVAAGRQAWHLLQAGKTQEAAAVLGGMTNAAAGPLGAASATIARRWLTRIDHAKVAAALKKAFLQEIQYPATLEYFRKWPAAEQPPLVDRWGRAWSYRIAGYKHIAGTSGQKYVLESVELKADTPLAVALKRDYAPLGAVAVERRLEAAAGEMAPLMIRVPGAAAGAVVQAGGAVGPFTLAWAGDVLAVLSDGDCWYLAVLPK